MQAAAPNSFEIYGRGRKVDALTSQIETELPDDVDPYEDAAAIADELAAWPASHWIELAARATKAKGFTINPPSATSRGQVIARFRQRAADREAALDVFAADDFEGLDRMIADELGNVPAGGM